MLPLGHAASLTWDNGGASPAAPVSTSGTWDTTSNAFWSNFSSDSLWNNSNGDTAVFGGSSGYNVTISGGVTVGGINFTQTGSTSVTLQSSTITLTGAQVTINSGSNASALGIISSAITGSSELNIAGSAGITLSSTSNSYTGGTRVTSGNLRLGATNALPTATTLTMAGGVFNLLGFNQTISALTGSASSALIRNSSTGSSILTINGSSTTAYTGQISDSGTGKTLSLNIGGTGQLTLSNTSALTYNGSTTVSGTGTLKLGSTTAVNLTNTASITVNGGTLTSGTGNSTLGVGGFSMVSGNLTPGGSGAIGSFTLAANQTFTTTGGTLNFDLLGSSTANYDQILGSGSGAFSLTGTTLALSGAFSSVAGTYQLFSGFGGTNSISGLNITGLGSGLSGSLDTTGLLTISAIPEPSTYAALAGTVMLGFSALRRRRNNGLPKTR